MKIVEFAEKPEEFKEQFDSWGNRNKDFKRPERKCYIVFEDGTKQDCSESLIESLYLDWLSSDKATERTENGFVIRGYSRPAPPKPPKDREIHLFGFSRHKREDKP
jgi:hypothetical protein